MIAKVIDTHFGRRIVNTDHILSGILEEIDRGYPKQGYHLGVMLTNSTQLMWSKPFKGSISQAAAKLEAFMTDTSTHLRMED